MSNWDGGGGDVEEVGDGDVEIIGFYVTRRRGIRVHELACLAFCRVLDLQPLLLKWVTLLPFVPSSSIAYRIYLLLYSMIKLSRDPFVFFDRC